MFALPEPRSLVRDYNLLRVEIVPKTHLIYQQGRKLATRMYWKVWQTENLIDDNDYAIVVFERDSVIANVNVQLKYPHSYLKSEKFFAPKHWQNYLKIKDSEIAEISGLAICDRIPNSLSRPVLMALVLGLKILLEALELRVYTTIQHKFLIRVLSQSLKLPFFLNEIILNPKSNVPRDNYWSRAEPPKIYYLEGLNPRAIASCNSFWSLFESVNLKILLNSRFEKNIAEICQKIA